MSVQKKMTFLSNIGRYEKTEEIEILQIGIKAEITGSFSENRSFSFFPDTEVINHIRSGANPQTFNDRFINIKNSIYDNIADYNQTVKDRLIGNARLSTRVVHAIGVIHQVLADLNISNLEKRRFVLINEKPGIPTIYHISDKSTVLSHVGQGPRWIEIPSIYLGLNTLDTIAYEKNKGTDTLYGYFKLLLTIEERAIETGYSHIEKISQETLFALNFLIDEVIRISKLAEIEYPRIPEIEKIKAFSPGRRAVLLRMLDARYKHDEMNFDYKKNIQAIDTLERMSRRYKKGDDLGSLYEIVRLLVAASGHDIHEVRNRANIILERLFAPKEFDAPLATTFQTINCGYVHKFRFKLSKRKQGYFIRIYRNSSSHEFTLERNLDYVDINLKHNIEDNLYMAEWLFDETGSYDYVIYKRMKKEPQWLIQKGTSGRINVIPDVRGEIILEIFPDIHGHTRVYWEDKQHPGLVYNENGEVIRLGKFSDITAHLEDLKRRYYITGLYILGIQKRGSNREDWAPEATSPSPFSPMDLTVIEPTLGGEKEFLELIEKAHSLDIKVIIDIVPHINRRSLAMPEDTVVKCYDDGGNLVVRASTDGRYGSWNDGKLLNYRKFEVWEFIARSILTLIDRYDIDGIRFDSAHAVPIMMKKNNYTHIYHRKRSHEEMVEGDIIINDKEDDHFITTGFYDSACRDLITNPFHFYITLAIERKLREKKKQYFINIAECFWGRERVLSRNGIIPYNSSLFKICENIIHGKVDVREIYHLYDNYFPSDLTPGTELLGILGNHDERRALNTFGYLGLKAAATLTSFMNNMIMDYEGSAEGEGWKVYLDNIYVNWNQFEYVSHRGIEGFYKKLYSFHRENQGKGHLIWANNHMVVAVMKLTKNKIILAAFNFANSNQPAALQFDNPVLPIDDSSFYRVVDPIYSPVTGKFTYFTGKELRISKLQTVVSYTDRVKILHLETVENPEHLYDDFLTDSFFRLCSINEASHFSSNFFFNELSANALTFDGFYRFIIDHLVPKFWKKHRYFLELGLKRSLFHMVRNNVKSGREIFKYIEQLRKSDDDILIKIGQSLKIHNRVGPLVFISAEAEPFSKIGGLSNVVYELPKELVKMGEEVYVITPLYRHGDDKAVEKMKNAVKKYRVKYTGKNIRFKMQETEYEVGVHRGTVDGIHYYLLDHHEFFDGLYWGYTAEEKLRKRIAFSRACAELITSFGLFPLFTFTNDAFAGIFNGIVKGDHVYSGNPNFQRTSFIHILHNVGWQYFDSYDRYERGFDHFSLFNLPYSLAENFLDPAFVDRINCLAAGVRFADRIITVSPSYAEQISIASDGLERLLLNVKGINNAIGRDFLKRTKQRFKQSGFVEKNYPVFIDKLKSNKILTEKIKKQYPEILKGPYECERIKDSAKREITTRMRNKLLLQTQNGLTIDPDKVLFSMIHRLVEQKGFQLLLEASEGIFKTLDFQGIIGGPVPSQDRKAEELASGLLKLSHYYRESVSVSIGFLDVATALLSSDVFLMPSMYEPGGISQLEAFACGCLVVARATGGLRDTVRPLQIKGRITEGNGFLFVDYTPSSFYDAMERCWAFFKNADEHQIFKARKKAESSVYYWDRSAREYVKEIYTLKEIIRIL